MMDGYFSRFGGLWIDEVDQGAVEQRLAAVAEAALRTSLADFARDGYVVLRGAVPAATIDAYLAEYEAAVATPGLVLINTPGHAKPTEPFDRELSLRPGTKMLDTGMLLPSGPELCFAPPVAKFLHALFEGPALAFQTLHFEMGSMQGIHQDTAYVVVDEQPMHVTASWLALEDIEPGTGELVYYVGGHRLPEHVYSGEYKHFNQGRDGDEQHDQHYRLLHEEAQRRGLVQERFLARKGDVLIWHADLPHGGSEVTVPNRTRRSLVTHYCPRELTPHYFPFIAEDRRRKLEVNGGNAMCSFYYDPATFQAPPPGTLVGELYASVLKRAPSAAELAAGIEALAAGTPFEQLFHRLVRSAAGRAQARVKLPVPPGDRRSPIVDPQVLKRHLRAAYDVGPDDLPGIEVDAAAMRAFWEAHAGRIAATPFRGRAGEGVRYHHGPGTFPLGDAALLRVMMAVGRPRRVMLAGGGRSAAGCVLDCAEELGLEGFSLTWIEAGEERLRGMQSRQADVVLLASEIEHLDPALFAELEAGDIVMLDTSHILKTGSDVCHVLFGILPALARGVRVHLRNCHYPFEYPRRWLLEQGGSWNEVYGLRAFLMYNERFGVEFWNSLFARRNLDEIRAALPPMAEFPGNGIWLKVGG